jgi:26S proteasome regulatory subunit N8
MPVNHQIVYHLQDALNLLPDLGGRELQESFVSSTNDWLLVVYLSSLVRAVIALHALVDNKASIGRAELEGLGEEEGDKDKKSTDSKKSKKDKEGEKQEKSAAS